MRRFILPLLIGLAVPACGPTTAPPPAKKVVRGEALDELLLLLGRRLAVMHDVARHKWAAKSPVEDPARERALLDDVAKRGRDLGLDTADTRAFFAAQIKAAKLVQTADFRRWEAEPGTLPGEAPDLAGVLRPRIDALNRDLLVALARLGPSSRGNRPTASEVRSRAAELLSGEGIDADVRAAAIEPLVGPAR